MNILIYDDDDKDVCFLKGRIVNFFESRCVDYHVKSCDNTEYLLKHLKEYDLLFLDIEINEENGIEIGLRIRDLNKDIKIVIISTYTKYLIDGYKIHADRYFLKPFSQQEFNIEFENIVHTYFHNDAGFYDDKISANKVYFKDILYIEFLNRKAYVHMVNSKMITTSYSLNHWEKIMENQYFSKPHKSYIVNLQYIGKLIKDNVMMINNDAIPLTRSFKEKFHFDYMNYLHKGI